MQSWHDTQSIVCQEKQFLKPCNIWRKMTAHKQKWPCFAWILSVLSIVFYCAGFLRVELELNEQIKRINLLSESVEETELLANILDLVVIARKITPGKFSH